MKVVVEAKEV